LHLAERTKKPILVLCYNVALATRLEALMREKGLESQITIRNFHRWCRDQLTHYHVPLPPSGNDFFEQLVQQVIQAVDRGQIPAGQYGAVLMDEGHDFQPEWLNLVAQMVGPETSSLLLLYDDAQSIYGKGRRKFSFRSVGIQAQGRTTILRLNYRNTSEVLKVAYEFAKDILTPEEADEDEIPLILPESADRHGPQPELIKLPNFNREIEYITGRFKELNTEGVHWGEMAVVHRNYFMGKEATHRLRSQGIPVDWLQESKASRHYRSDEDSVKVITLHSSKGLEFPVVAIPGLGFLPYEDSDLQDEVRLMYVGMTRAMDRLIMTFHRNSDFVGRMTDVLEKRVA
ncbi:MAG: ATP-binding domain-containing protein, partial [Desulfobacterales bacterium]|nr:ATP-binding domain-containing protein [Desulfobacterales bacterium]